MTWDPVAAAPTDRDVLPTALGIAAAVSPLAPLDTGRVGSAFSEMVRSVTALHPAPKRPVLTLGAKVMVGTMVAMDRLGHPAPTVLAAALASAGPFAAASLDQPLACIRPKNTPWTVTAELVVLFVGAVGALPGPTRDSARTAAASDRDGDHALA